MSANAFVDSAKVMAKVQITIPEVPPSQFEKAIAS